MNKDVIYVDIDDEITSIIEKVRASKAKIVALVLPKRATTLQSIVNMKLLQRGAKDAKKSLVLITSDVSIVPLAGAVGMHVAKTLQSKPAIPAAPEAFVADESNVDVEEEIDPRRSIGELAGGTAAVAAAQEDETIELDNTEDEANGTQEATAKSPRNKFKIPNFEKFRTRLMLVVLALVLLLGGSIFALVSMPKAVVLIKTNTSSINTNVSAEVTTATQTFDVDKAVLPAKSEETKKTNTEKVPATGKKDIGTKASGNVSFYNCNVDDTISGTSHVLPAGTGISSQGLTFITQQAVTVGPSHFSGTTCKYDVPSSQVKVVAQNSGDQYNLNARSYQVAGASSITAKDTDGMTGGTSNIVTVVSQSDIDDAKQKLQGKTSDAATDELKQTLEVDGYYALTETINNTDPAITTSANVGDQATDVTVTSATTYTLLGVKKDDLVALIEKDAKTQIDAKTQKILSNGLDDAQIKVTNKKSPTDMSVSVQSTVIAGPEIDKNAVIAQIAGKKKGEVQSLLGSRPGVKEVDVRFSPFWVSKVPKKASKVTIQLDTPVTNAK